MPWLRATGHAVVRIPLGEEIFSENFGQCMGPVPIQYREQFGELPLVARTSYEYNGWRIRRVDPTSPRGRSPLCLTCQQLAGKPLPLGICRVIDFNIYYNNYAV